MLLDTRPGFSCQSLALKRAPTIALFAPQFLLSIQDSSWFQGTISTVDLDYEVVCPYSSLGCRHICLRTELDKHLAENCNFIKEPEDSDSIALVSTSHGQRYDISRMEQRS